MEHGLKTYWGDCPWQTVFITDSARAPSFPTIAVGKPKGWDAPGHWSKRILAGLSRIATPVVLWTSEDNWLTGPPDTGAIIDFARHIEFDGADYIRLYPGWDHDKSVGPFKHDSRLLVMAGRSPYRCSLKPALWRNETFRKLLREGESAWDFERNGSRRSKEYRGRFLAVADWGHYFPMVTRGDPTGPWVKSPIVKGRWTTAARKYARREGLDVDFSKHPMDEIIDDKLKGVDWVL